MRAGIAVLLLLAACESQLSPPELIADLRILGVRAEPAEGTPATEIALDALVVTPDPATEVELLWLACVTSATSITSAPCLDQAAAGIPPLCAVDPEAAFCLLGADASAWYRLPTRALEGRAPGQPGKVYVTLLAAEAARGGLLACQTGLMQRGELPEFCRIAVKRLNVLPAGETAWNANPALTELTIAGTRLAVALAPDAAETTPDGPEALYLSWFVTAGELDSFRTDGDAGGLVNQWTPVGAPGTVYVVVRDGRGGEGWISASR